MAATKRTTMGTPCSGNWDTEWVEDVDHVEQQLGHRICGAHSPAWTPCKLTSTHKNGRCRFHGGAKGIGAPLGNRNAIIHGLYSRRLQRCGLHCPMWQHCPQSGKDVLALEERERPPCVYEAKEYDAIYTSLTFSLEKEKVSKEKSIAAFAADDCDDDPTSHAERTHADRQVRHCEEERRGNLDSDTQPATPADLLHHNIATFQVMLTRAQAALGIAKMTEETHAQTDAYTMSSPKVSALLQAETWISRELRSWLRLLAYEPLRKVLGMTDPPEADKPKDFLNNIADIIQEAGGIADPSTHPNWFTDDPLPDDDLDGLTPAPA